MTNIGKYLEEMKKIQENLLDYLDNEEDIEEKYQNLQDIFYDFKILENRYEMKSFLHLIHKITSNHYHGPNFFSKIKKIIQFFNESIKNNFSNYEIFQIFKFNKKVLLFLLEEQIFNIDDSIYKLIKSQKYFFNEKIESFIRFFLPEITSYEEKNCFHESLIDDLPNTLPENFYEKRRICDNNDNYVCELIRKDLIKDFSVFVNKNSYSLNSLIQESFYETNNFLLKRKTISLIEYAAFFGSIQIFNYLLQNGVELTSSVWTFAIHGNNSEIFHILEDNNVDYKYDELLIESIKCHHIDITNYIEYNLQNNTKYSIDIFVNKNCIKYYNFIFMQLEFINESLFHLICKYDYCLILYDLLKEKNFDINEPLVIIIYLLYSTKYILMKLKIISFNEIKNHIF